MASAATTPTGVYGQVYECTRGVSPPVYESADRRNCSYTPSHKNSDGFLAAIWSCWQSAPPTHNPTVPVVVSLSRRDDGPPPPSATPAPTPDADAFPLSRRS
jgi:hypothetical protein